MKVSFPYQLSLFQVTGPVLVLGIPIFAVYVVVASQMAKLHVLAAIAPIFISMHSMVSTICIIMTTPTYRLYVEKHLDKIRKYWKAKKPKVEMPRSPVVMQRPAITFVNTFL